MRDVSQIVRDLEKLRESEDFIVQVSKLGEKLYNNGPFDGSQNSILFSSAVTAAVVQTLIAKDKRIISHE